MSDPLGNRLTALLLDTISEYAQDAGLEIAADGETRLLGQGSPLDSLGLVVVVTGFEAKVNDAFDAAITLANERAMSMNKSPFRSVAALTEYAGELLKEAGKA